MANLGRSAHLGQEVITTNPHGGMLLQQAQGFAQEITSSLQGIRLALALVLLLHCLCTVYTVGLRV